MPFKMRTSLEMKQSQAKGFTLIELMVATLLLSLGLLGLASLELRALQSARITYFYNVALVQMINMMERLQVEAPEQALNSWNFHNAALLPHGRGSCHCHHDQCQLDLRWESSGYHELNLEILKE